MVWMERIDAGLEKLIQVGQCLESTKNIEGIAEAVTNAARTLIGADGATFVLRENDHCHYVEESATEPLWKGRRLPMETCINGWVMNHAQSVVIDNIFADPRINLDLYRKTSIKALVIVPVPATQVIGAIGNYWIHSYQASPEELLLLRVLAELTFAAIQRVQLKVSLEKKLSEADQVSRAKDDFLMLLSHELRTPLNVILGWAELLREGPLCSEAQWQLGIRTIHHNGLAQKRIIDDLMDTSKIMSGCLRIEIQPVDLKAIVRTLKDSFVPLASERKINLRFHLEEDVGLVEGDADRLQQVISNLICNSTKFTPEGGQIDVFLEERGDSVVVRVEDTGQGLTSDQLTRVFDRFWQAEGPTQRRQGGLGLGLSLVATLVEAHGGKVQAQSEGLGKGAVFTVWLPLLGLRGTTDLRSPLRHRRLRTKEQRLHS